jgi:hypothetical protein
MYIYTVQNHALGTDLLGALEILGGRGRRKV